MKPKIKKVGNYWFCYTDFSKVASGTTPEAAFNKWVHFNDSMGTFKSIGRISDACKNVA